MDLKVDGLLASIRQRVDDDLSVLTTSMATESRGTLMRGALREMRVNMGNQDDFDTAARFLAPRPALPPREELSTLRERIRRKVEENEITLAEVEAPPSPAHSLAEQRQLQRPMRHDFSGILASQPLNQSARPRYDAPPLRPSYGQENEVHDHEFEEEQQQDYNPQNSYPVAAPMLSSRAEAATPTPSTPARWARSIIITRAASWRADSSSP